jgi:hypothetical protein
MSRWTDLLLWKPHLLLFDRLGGGGGSFDTGVCSGYARKMVRATAIFLRNEERSTQQKQKIKAREGK